MLFYDHIQSQAPPKVLNEPEQVHGNECEPRQLKNYFSQAEFRQERKGGTDLLASQTLLKITKRTTVLNPWRSGWGVAAGRLGRVVCAACLRERKKKSSN